MLNKVGVVSTDSFRHYTLDEPYEKDPRAVYAEWNKRLDNLNKLMDWHTLDENLTPANMSMKTTFPYSTLRTAFERNASSEQTTGQVMSSPGYISERNKCYAEQGVLKSEGPIGGPSKDTQRVRVLEPSVLLHPFYATFFGKMSIAASNEAKLQYLGVCFLLAAVLVHKLAHCFNAFPEVKCWDANGAMGEMYASIEEAVYLRRIDWNPECGLSWERSVFQGQSSSWNSVTTKIHNLESGVGLSDSQFRSLETWCLELKLDLGLHRGWRVL